jgi:outer membrane protein
MRNTFRFLILAAALACGAAQAQSNIVKFGVIRYDPHSKTTGVTGLGIPAGADAKVHGANTLLLTYEYLFKPDWGLELVLGVPPKIAATGTGSVSFLGEVLTARNLAPTLLLSHHFGSADDKLRFYAGLGVNYTKFIDAKSQYGFDVKLSDSVGLAAHAGVDWLLGKEWGLFASVGYSNVKSKLVATGATVLQTTIDFRPRTYSLGASYRF